jgi:hypothetical protein
MQNGELIRRWKLEHLDDLNFVELAELDFSSAVLTEVLDSKLNLIFQARLIWFELDCSHSNLTLRIRSWLFMFELDSSNSNLTVHTWTWIFAFKLDVLMKIQVWTFDSFEPDNSEIFRTWLPHNLENFPQFHSQVPLPSRNKSYVISIPNDYYSN